MSGAAQRKAIIQCRGVVDRFGSQTVHDDLDLDVYRGEVLGIVGGSGTGKSVLLRSIVGLNRPAAGSIRVFLADVLNTSEEEREAGQPALGRAVPAGRALLGRDRATERQGADARASAHRPAPA